MSEEYNNDRSFEDDLADIGEQELKKGIEKNIKEQVAKHAAETGAKTAAAGTGAGATASAATGASTGASAGATAGTAAGGSASAGGSAAGGPVALIAMAVLLAAKKLRDEANEAFDPMKESKAPELGAIGALFLVCIIVVNFLFPSFFTQNGYTGANFLEPTEAVEEYKAKDMDTDKQALFDKMFELYGIKPDDIVMNGNSLYSESNNKNFAVCKAIINQAIENAFNGDNGYVVEFINNSLIDILNSALRWCFEGDGQQKTKESFFNSRYPYCLNYYTVDDYIRKRIPEDELNDDLNYAEVLAIIELNENIAGREFTFSDFYDIVCANDMQRHFVEIDYSDIIYYVGRNTDRTFSSLEEAQAYVDANRPWKKVKKNKKTGEIIDDDVDEEDISKSETPAMDFDKLKKAADENEKAKEPGQKINEVEEVTLEEVLDGDTEDWRIHCYVEIDTFPYGLIEMFDVAGVSQTARSTALPSRTNYEMMNEYERNMRLLCEEYLPFGTGFEEERDPRSKVYDMAPTGRSAFSYINKSLLYLSECGIIPEWYTANVPRLDIVHVPTDSSVILNMDMYYISQLGNYGKRGNSGSSINSQGCIDCSYTMCAQYLLSQNININAVSGSFVTDKGLFDTPSFLSYTGLTRELNTSSWNETEIRDSINQGCPVVMKINGHWNYEGHDYHNSDSDHFLVVSGYDQNGFCLLDPASDYNSKNLIPYEAFENVDIQSWSKVGTGPNVENENAIFK